MTDKIYHLEFNEISNPHIEDQIETEIGILFKNIMTQEECYNNVAFGENDSLFLFTDIGTMNKIVNFSKSIGILKSMKEISEDILIRSYNDNFKKTFLEKTEYKHILENFLSSNITSDVILDRINANGIGSLTKGDYTILELV